MWTLTNGKGNCVNFANLFMALLRAAGIPVRKVHGHMIHEWTSTVAHVWIEVFYPDKGWIQYESSHWMLNEGPLPWTFLTSRHIKAYSSPFPGVSSTGKFDEEIQTTITITSSPSMVSSNFSPINSDEFVTFVFTVSNNRQNANAFLITATAIPSNWNVSLSQDSVFIDPEEEWGETRDIPVTISPPENTFIGDLVTITVTATSQKTGLSENMILQVAVLSFRVDVSSMSNDFGDITVGSSSTPLEISISNTGDLDLNVSGMTLSDTGNYSFDVNGGSNPAGTTTPTIPVGESHTVTLIFNPISEGSKSANFEILFNDPGETSINVSLTGTGVPVTGIKDENLSKIPAAFILSQIRPNPFNNST